MNVHFVIHPGLQLEAFEHVTLEFVQPVDAKHVWINVYEIDRWSVDGSTMVEHGADQGSALRASIEGELVDGQFLRTSIKRFYDYLKPPSWEPAVWTEEVVDAADKTPDKPKGPQQQLLPGKVRFLPVDHGGTTSLIPFQCIGGDRERGYFEVAFVAWAEDESGPWALDTQLLSIRNVPEKRAELVYVAATQSDFDGEATDYADLATAYWGALKDNHLGRPLHHLVDIVKDFEGLEPSSRNNQPLGVVHIVAHGAEDGWLIRWQEHWNDPLEGDVYERTHSPVDPVRGILPGQLLTRPTPPPRPTSDVLDELSLVVIWSCDVGHNAMIMDDMFTFFGGRATVLAPKYEVGFRRRGDELSCVLFHHWHLIERGKQDWPDADTLASRLRAAYSSPATPNQRYKDWDEFQWKPIASITSADTTSDAFRTSFHHSFSHSRECTTAELYDDDGAQRSDEHLLDLVVINNPSSPTPADSANRARAGKYAWEFEITKLADDKYLLTGTCSATVFSLHLLLGPKDEAGKIRPTVPDLQNPDHFASRP